MAAKPKITTVVVLVQENRSFDHMLGWMKRLNPAIDGLTGAESNLLTVADPKSAVVRVDSNAAYVVPDVGHSVQDIYEQVYGVPYAFSDATPITPAEISSPPMSGFAQNGSKQEKDVSRVCMKMFPPEALPVYESLAKHFAVCDRWFASVPASTQPNRLFVHSATSHGLVSNKTAALEAGLPQRTIFDSLHDEGHSFGIYYQFPPSTLFYRNLRQLKYVFNFHQFDLDFKRHCREGKLPNYVVVEQRFFDLPLLPGNDDHPSHDVLEGQRFVKEVYEALRGSPQWEEMLFVVTYDEHGGFFDHVPTPVGVPSPDGIVSDPPENFKFDRLGVRVPTFFISPWINPGTVVHGPKGPLPNSEYEHSSIPATVKKIFGLKNFLTKRDEWAGTFDAVLTRATPRTDCPEKLPDVKKPAAASATTQRAFDASELVQRVAPHEAPLSEFQAELVQLAAVLNGDHAKEENFLEKIAQGMTVGSAAKYCRDAMQCFLGKAEQCLKNGESESHIPVLLPKPAAATATAGQPEREGPSNK